MADRAELWREERRADRERLALSYRIPQGSIDEYGVTLYPKRHADMRATWVLKCAGYEQDTGILTDFRATELQHCFIYYISVTLSIINSYTTVTVLLYKGKIPIPWN